MYLCIFPKKPNILHKHENSFAALYTLYNPAAVLKREDLSDDQVVALLVDESE